MLNNLLIYFVSTDSNKNVEKYHPRSFSGTQLKIASFPSFPFFLGC